MADLEAGRTTSRWYSVELSATCPALPGRRPRAGAAAWVGRDAQGATYVWPWSFSQLADEYDRRYGLDDAHLRAIGEINLINARRNPERTDPAWDPDARVVRRRRCGQSWSRAGCAGMTAVRSPTAPPVSSWSERAGRHPGSYIQGWGHRTVRAGSRCQCWTNARR